MQALVVPRRPCAAAIGRPALGGGRHTARWAVRVCASGRIANKELLEVAQRAAQAGAKVGPMRHTLQQGGAMRPRAEGTALAAHFVHPPTAPHVSTFLPAAITCSRGRWRRCPWLAQVVMEAVDKPRTIEFKGATDLVTDTDRASEDAVLAAIQQAFPNHAVLGEEGGVSGEA